MPTITILFVQPRNLQIVSEENEFLLLQRLLGSETLITRCFSGFRSFVNQPLSETSVLVAFVTPVLCFWANGQILLEFSRLQGCNGEGRRTLKSKYAWYFFKAS